MATRECKICGRERDLETKFEKAPGKDERKFVCVTCTEAIKTQKAPSP